MEKILFSYPPYERLDAFALPGLDHRLVMITIYVVQSLRVTVQDCPHFLEEKENIMAASSLSLSREDLDGRLNCFGEFDENDSICLKSCALNINCAIAKNKFLGFQLLDDSGFPYEHFEAFEAE